MDFRKIDLYNEMAETICRMNCIQEESTRDFEEKFEELEEEILDKFHEIMDLQYCLISNFNQHYV